MTTKKRKALTPEESKERSEKLSGLYEEIASLQMGAASLFRKAIKTHRKVVDAHHGHERSSAAASMERYIDSAQDLLYLATEKAEEADGIEDV